MKGAFMSNIIINKTRPYTKQDILWLENHLKELLKTTNNQKEQERFNNLLNLIYIAKKDF